LSLASRNIDLQIPRLDLIRDFEDIYKLLLDSGWLIKDYQKRFLCDECGATHEVHNFDGEFFIGCDADEDSGAIEISKDDLLAYSLSISKLASWLSGQIGLLEQPEKTGDESWHLGLLKLAGKNRKVYFSLPQNLNKILNSPKRVVLFVDENQHQEHPQAVNLLSLLSVSGNCFKFDRNYLFDSLANHEPIEGKIVKINEKLILYQTEKKKSFITFGNNFEYKFPIAPLMFNITYHLDKIKNTPRPRKSSAEIVEAGGISKSRRSVSNKIKSLNLILTEESWLKLILRDADGKYYTNPNLYNK